MSTEIQGHATLTRPSRADVEEQNTVELFGEVSESGDVVHLRYSMTRDARSYRLFREKEGRAETRELVSEGADLPRQGALRVPFPPDVDGSGGTYTFILTVVPR